MLCHRRQTCRLCESSQLELVFSLVPTPPANAFVKKEALCVQQETFPLDVFFCLSCSHVQLLDVVDPSLLFKDYVYVSGTSPVFVEHFRKYADFVMSCYDFSPHSLVVEIGSNDGTLLQFFKNRGFSVLGIDPAQEIAKNATSKGIETWPRFFNADLAQEILSQKGKADIVIANNVFAHIDDLKGVTQGIRKLLSPKGIFAFEVSYLKDVYQKTLFDTIYHEHLCYHSVGPLERFFKEQELELIEAIPVESHGGSLRGIVQLAGGPYPRGRSVADAIRAETELGLYQAQTYKNFARQIDALKRELNSVLKDLKSKGKKAAGFGAPAKATTLMYHFGIGKEWIDFIVDDSPLKQNLFSPGLHIPVYSSNAIEERKPDYLVILAWNFAESIVAKNKKFKDQGGHFIVPVPKVEVL